jgi:uncharacterized protein YuzB (UPF0349 family)
MSVGEFTVSNIHMDEDKREEEKQRDSQLDIEKFKSDVAAAVQLAEQVCLPSCATCLQACGLDVAMLTVYWF